MYYWVILPIVREVLFITEGRDLAESIWISLFLFQPTTATFAHQESLPGSRVGLVLYLVKPLNQLIGFVFAALAVFFFRDRAKSLYRSFTFVLLLLFILLSGILLADNARDIYLSCIAVVCGFFLANKL